MISDDTVLLKMSWQYFWVPDFNISGFFGFPTARSWGLESPQTNSSNIFKILRRIFLSVAPVKTKKPQPFNGNFELYNYSCFQYEGEPPPRLRHHSHWLLSLDMDSFHQTTNTWWWNLSTFFLFHRKVLINCWKHPSFELKTLLKSSEQNQLNCS